MTIIPGGHSSSTQVLRYPFSPQQHTPDVILPIQHLNCWQLTGVPLHHMERTQQTHVQLGKRKFTVTFIIADVRSPILGADFLRRHKLLVDLCGQKLIDAHSFQSYACAATNNDLCVSPIATVDSNHYKQCLLQQYPELLRPTFHAARPSHDVSHYITTDAPPVHCKTRRLPPDRLAIANAEFL